MNASFAVLLYMSGISGAVMVIGGIVMMFKQIISIYRESRRMEVKIPVMGAFNTTVPALMLFAIGFIPLIYPIWHLIRSTERQQITGTVLSNEFPVYVYAATETDTIRRERAFSLLVPKVEGEYQVLFIAGETILELPIDPRKLQGSEYQLGLVEIDTGDGAVGSLDR